jgi:hypothetical protein
MARRAPLLAVALLLACAACAAADAAPPTPPADAQLLAAALGEAPRLLGGLASVVALPRRRRGLQQQQQAAGAGAGTQTAAAPVCEVDLSYVATAIAPGSFTAALTLTNNRELGGHWQLVFRHAEFATHRLAAAGPGAVALSPGSAAGAPVRLVDASEGGLGAGASATVALTTATGNATDDASLLLERVSVNGLACAQLAPAAGERLGARRCAGALALSAALGGPARDDGACRAAYCCGYVLRDAARALPPVADGPAAEAPPARSPAPAPVSSPLSSAPLAGELTKSPPAEEAPLGMGAMIGAVAGMGVALLAAAGLALWAFRRRRQQQLAVAEAAAAAEDAKPGSAAGGIASALTGRSARGSALSLRHHGLGAAAAAFSTGTSDVSGNKATLADEGGAPDGADATARAGAGVALAVDGDGAEEVVLFEQLGSGAFGTVYRGEWQGARVAVKVLTAAAGCSPKELESFRQEAAVLSRLRHPNIVAFLAASTAPPTVCVVEELAEGGSLHARLHECLGPSGRRADAPLPLPELIRLATGIAAAMAYLHPGVVHRDLKSQNVLLSADGTPKVCDFGIAKFKAGTFVSTAHGQAGTPAYMVGLVWVGVGGCLGLRGCCFLVLQSH